MSETIDYNRLVSIIFKQINLYRENPRLLIPVLEKRLKKYDDKKFMPLEIQVSYCRLKKGVGQYKSSSILSSIKQSTPNLIGLMIYTKPQISKPISFQLRVEEGLWR